MPATSAPDNTIANKRHQPGTEALRKRRHAWQRARLQDAQTRPAHQAEDQEGQPEVSRQPVLRNARIVDQPALDHVPTHRTL
jgi:hypothetical protein